MFVTSLVPQSFPPLQQDSPSSNYYVAKFFSLCFHQLLDEFSLMTIELDTNL